MPTLRQLEYLLAVAETLHFRRAAERVDATQPTLSEQIKAMEDRLGARLVERTRSRVVLTPVGAEVVEIARRMMRDAEAIRDVCKKHGETLSGVVRIGLSPTVGAYMLSRIIPELHEAFPDLKLYVREDLPRNLLRSLDEGSLEMIVAPEPIRGTDFEVDTLFREPLYVAMAADHPLAKKPVLTREDMKGVEVLTLVPGYHMHEQIRQLCADLGARLRYEYEGTSLDTLREMVATGLGVTFLPGLYVRTIVSRDPSVRTALLQGVNAQRTIGLAWRRSSPRGASYRQIAEIARRSVERELSWRRKPEPATVA